MPLSSERLPKILGADVELGNFIVGVDRQDGTGATASRLLLSEIAGITGRPTSSPITQSAYSYEGWRAPVIVSAPEADPQDYGRRFLPSNGGCAYVDLDHLELALPETTSAFDCVACWRAMLGIAREAMIAANRRLPEGRRIQVLVNCSDGLGHSYGSHHNVLLTRTAWDNIIHRKPHYMAFLSAFQISSIVFTGQGKVGSENDRPPVEYQLSQRADFIETVVGQQTTVNRPVVNSRDEPLSTLARLHVIFFDSTLCQTASLLRAGTLQIIVAMLEAGCVDASLALEDPLDALQTWSRDPSLTARARTTSGVNLTANDLQLQFLAAARIFASGGGCDGIVPRAAEILDLWEDTLIKLAEGDFVALGRRLDWVLKRQILERAMTLRPGLTWRSPQIKHLDHLYASLDEDDGLFWKCESAGLVDCMLTRDAIERAAQEPPADTRAWTRARLLRAAGGAVDQVDWDFMTLALASSRGNGRWLDQRTIRLPHPHQATREDHAAIFNDDNTLDDIVEALDNSRYAIS